MTTTQPQDVPVAVHAQTSQAGRAYVEAQVTGQASIDLAGAIAARLSSNGMLDIAPGTNRASIVTLIAGAITDHPVELTPEQADELATELQAAADNDAERDENTYWGESA